MATRFEKARFHINYGPKSLFDRVMFKMRDVTQLDLTGSHFIHRTGNRKIPKTVLDRIQKFSSDEWTLISCEVRTDKGKFINSTWETTYCESRYWITIGFNNLVETVIEKESSGEGKIVKSGQLFDYVSLINDELIRGITHV